MLIMWGHSGQAVDLHHVSLPETGDLFRAKSLRRKDSEVQKQWLLWDGGFGWSLFMAKLGKKNIKASESVNFMEFSMKHLEQSSFRCRSLRGK